MNFIQNIAQTSPFIAKMASFFLSGAILIASSVASPFKQFTPQKNKPLSQASKTIGENGEVLGDFDTTNIPDSIQFNLPTNLLQGLTVQGDFIASGPASFNDDLEVGGNLTARNVLYGLTAGDGIIIGTGQRPKVSLNVDYVKSIEGLTGDVSLEEGGGISIDGTEISNSDRGSGQKIFKNIAVSGQDTVVAGSNDATLTFVAGTGVALTTNNTTKAITIDASSASLSSGWQDDGTIIRPVTLTDKVGIGTTIPRQALDVGNFFVVDTSNSRVGVGISSPTSTLHVVGTATVSSSLSAGATTLASLNNSNGGITNAGPITGATGLTSTGTITFGSLSTGILHSDSSGVISSSAISLALGSSDISGTLGTTNGGTGISSYTTGDVLYASASNTLSRLGIGSSGQVLMTVGGIPAWSNITAGSCPTCIVNNPSSTQSITPTGASTTGLVVAQSSGGTTNTFAVTNNGSTSYYLVADSAGRIGIGLTAPGYGLEVAGTARINGAFTIGDALADTVTSTASQWSFSNPTTMNLADSQQNALVFETNLLVLDTSRSRIGIGTTNPSVTLDVNGSINLATGSTYKINNTDVLTATNLGANVVSSSLTTVGNLTAGSISNGFGSIQTAGNISTSGTGTITSADLLTASNGFTLTTGALSLNSTSGLVNLSLNSSSKAFNVNNFFDIDTSNSRIGIGTTAPGSTLTFGSASTVGLATSTTALNFASGLLNLDTSNSRVGIGTTAPAYTFDINGTLRVGSTTTLNSLTYTWPASQSSGYLLQTDGAGTLSWFDATSGGSLGPWTLSGTSLFPDLATYNVGIGNSAPGTKLDVTGTGRFSSTLTASSGLTLTTGALSLTSTSGTAGLTLDTSTTAFNVQSGLFDIDTSNSRVGIGTTAPRSKLQLVNGDLHVGTGTFDNPSGTEDAYIAGNLEVDGTIIGTVSGPIVPNGFTQGSVTFAGSGGTLSQNNTKFYWDDTNYRLGVGISSPGQTLQVGTFFAVDTSNSRLGIGTTSPTSTLHFGSASTVALASSTTALNFASGLLNIDASNTRIGIGITAPGARLQINTTTANTTGLIVKTTDDSTTKNLQEWHDSSGAVMAYVSRYGDIQTNGPSGFCLGSTGTCLQKSGGSLYLINGNYTTFTSTNSSSVVRGAFNFTSDTTNSLTVNGNILVIDASNSRVGIGTTNPTQKLDVGRFFVVDSSNSFVGIGTTSPLATIDFGSASTVNLANSLKNALTFETNLLVLDTSRSRIGIGTTDPGAPLHIVTTDTGMIIDGSDAQDEVSVLTLRRKDIPSRYISLSPSGGTGIYASSLVLSSGTLGLTEIRVNNPITLYDSNRTITGVNNSVDTLIKGGNGSGVDITGANLQLAGGAATGSAAGGSLLFYTSVAGTSGSTVQTLTERMRLNSSGNLGIGTSSPTNRFQVKDFFAIDVTNNRVGIGTTAPSATLDFGSASTINLANSSAQALNIEAGLLNLDTSRSRVGIGTTDPGYVLDVNGTFRAAGAGTFSSTLGVTGATTLSSTVDITSHTTIGGSLRVNGTGDSWVLGNFGVGTTAPTTRLHVYGSSTTSQTMLNVVNDIWTGQASNEFTNLQLTVGDANTGGTSGLIRLGAQSHSDNSSFISFLPSSVNFNTYTEVMRIVGNNASVGIGTATPTNKLQVANFFAVDSSNSKIGIGTTAPSATLDFGSASTVNIVNTSTQALNFESGLLNLDGSNSRVGIGTLTPLTKLEIAQDSGSDFTTLLKLSDAGNSATGRPSIAFGINTAGTASWARLGAEGGSGYASPKLFLQVADSSQTLQNRMVIDKDGNTGIGTTAPTNKLQVANFFAVDTSNSYIGIGTTAPGSTLDFGSAATVNLANSLKNALAFETNLLVLDTSRSRVGVGTTNPIGNFQVGSFLTVDSSNSLLGVGTTAPGVTLDVVGNLRYSSTLYVPVSSSIYAGGFDDVNIDSDGKWTFKRNLVAINGSDASLIPFTARGTGGQTGNLQEWQNSASTAVAKVDATGNLAVGLSAPSTTAFRVGTFFDVDNSNSRIGIGTTAPSATLDFGSASTVNLADSQKNALNIESGLLNLDTSRSRVGVGTTDPQATFEVVNNSVSTGKGFQVSSTSTSFSSGILANIDWSPSSATTATGDVLAVNVGANGIVGNIFNVKDNGTSVFSVSQSQIVSALPHSFTAAGDVSIAYDLNFTNQTSSYIKSNAPLYLEVGESWESNDLTLRTFNSGALVLDLAGGATFAQAQNWTLASNARQALNIQSGLINLDSSFNRVGIGTTNPNVNLQVGSFLAVDSSNSYIGIGTTAPGSTLDFGSAATVNIANSLKNGLTFETSLLVLDTSRTQVGIGTTNPGYLLDVAGTFGTSGNVTFGDAVGDTVTSTAGSWTFSSATTVNLADSQKNSLAFETSLLVLDTSRSRVGIGTTDPATKLQIVGGDCSDDAGGGGCTADYAELYPASEDVEKGDLLVIDTQSTNYAVKRSTESYQAGLIGIVSSAPAAIADGSNLMFMNTEYKLDPRRPAIALVGRVPVKVASDSAAIKPGDALTSSAQIGRVMKATKAGVIIGKALESWTPDSGKDKILTFVVNSWHDPDMTFTASGDVLGTGNHVALENFTPGETDHDYAELIASFKDLKAGQQIAQEKEAILSDKVASLEARLASLEDSSLRANDSERGNLNPDEIATPDGSFAHRDRDDNPSIAMGSETIASASAVLGAADELLNRKEATLSTLMVTDNANVNNLAVTGNFSIGLLSVDGLDNSISSLASPLKLQSEPGSENIDIFNGKIVMTPNGGIKLNKLSIDESDDDTKSIGEGVIEADATKVVIKTTSVTSKSRIFVTPKTILNYPLVVTSKKAGESFTVEMKKSEDTDVKFDWWVVN